MLSQLLKISLKPEVLNLVAQIERFQGVFSSKEHLSQSFIQSQVQTTIITSSGSSTRIEGAILTDNQVGELIKSGCKITHLSSRSEREVAGYVKCLHYIYQHYTDIEITEKTIRELHQLLCSELMSSQLPKKQRGAYKDVPNNVVEKDLSTGKEKVWFETTLPGPQTEVAMYDLINSYQLLLKTNEIHHLLLIAGFVVHFLAIHPFRDGNGRLSRLMTILLLMKSGFSWLQYSSHEKIIEDNKERYYVALRNTQSTFTKKKYNYNHWLMFFLNVVVHQTQYLERELKKHSPVSVMNKNEQIVYKIIKENKECQIGFIIDQTDLTRSGLKSLLKRLIEKKYIKMTGRGKCTVYSIFF